MTVATIGALRVTLGANTAAFEAGLSRAQREMAKTGKQMSALGAAMQGVGARMTLGVTTPLVAVGVAMSKAAIDAAEMRSAFNVSFGRMAKDAEAWAKSTGDALGRSTTEMQAGALALHSLFRAGGPATKQTAELSKQFAILAQDLSSFHNVSPEQALEKLRAGLAGEAEPLRAFGIFLNEAAVASEALRLGLSKTSDELTEQDKIVARSSLIYKGAGDALGDVQRTSEGTANKIREARASFQELSITVGDRLVPAMTPLINGLAKVLEQFGKLPEPVQTATIGAAALATALGPLTMGLGMMVSGGSRISTALVGLGSAGGKAGVAMTGLGRSMAFLTGPWGLIIGGTATALGIYYSKVLAAKDASEEAKTVTDKLRDATAGYRDAVLAAEEATAKDKETALQAVQAKRALMLQALRTAQAQLAEATATMRLNEARSNAAFNAPPRFDPKVGEYVYPDDETARFGHRAAQAAADVAKYRSELEGHQKDLRQLEADLKRPVDLGGGVINQAAVGTRKLSAAVREARHETEELQQDLEAAIDASTSGIARQAQEVERHVSVLRQALQRGAISLDEYRQRVTYLVQGLEQLDTSTASIAGNLSTDLKGVEDLYQFSPAGMREQELAIQATWERAVDGGVRAAFDGDLLGYLRDTLKNSLASSLSQTISSAIAGSRGPGGGGMLGGISSAFGGGGGGILGGLGGLFGGGGGGFVAGSGSLAVTVTPAVGSVAGGGIMGSLGGLGAAFMSNPVGWIAGGVALIGGMMGIFGGNKAKKEAARRKALEEQEKMLTEAREMAAQAVEKLKQAEQERASLIDRMLRAQGRNAEALARSRELELPGMDETNRGLAQLTWAWEDYSEALAAADAKVSEARANLSAAYEREAGALEDVRDGWKDMIESLRAFGQTLAGTAASMRGPDALTQLVSKRFADVVERMKAGDKKAFEELQSTGEEYLAAGEQSAKSLLDMQRITASVRDAVETGQSLAGAQVTIAEQQLAALQAQVSGLIDVRTGVQTVADAIANLTSAMNARAAVAATAPASTGDNFLAPDPWAVGGARWNDMRARGQADLEAGAWGDPNKNNGGNAQDMVLGNLRTNPDQVRAWYETAKALGSMLAVDAYLGLQPGTFRGFATNLGLPAFARGGALKVMGAGGMDKNLMSINGSPAAWVSKGETIQVDPARSGGGVQAVLEQHSRMLEALVLSNGEMARQMRRWDGDGLPPEREAAL